MSDAQGQTLDNPAATPPVTILDAMAHPGLFGPQFDDASWDAWRVFLAALFALPMTVEQRAVYAECTGRTEAPARPFREGALVVGRRGGKSRVLAVLATFLATFIDHRPFLAAGEMGTVAIIAADRRQARTVLRYVLGLIRAVPALAAMIEGETAESVTLNNAVMIEVHTASFKVTRGYTLVAVLADEIAFWPAEDAANPDLEIIRAVRPGLASIPHSLLLLASSPYAKRGVLWATYRRHFGVNDGRVLVWQAGTERMNPGIDPAIIIEAREDDPEAASAEYDALFRSDIAAFVSREIVDACIERGCHERAPARAIGHRYVAFIDASGGSGSDSMTCAVAHLENGIPILDAIRERRPPFSPDDVTDEYAALLKSYGVSKAESDRWGGDWVGEAFRKRGITVDPCAKPKSDLYKEALPLLNARRCSLLDLPRLITQLSGLERRTARGGRDSIDHGPGAHDDVANCCAGVLVLAGVARQPMRFDPAALARFGVTSPAGIAAR